MPVPVLGFAPGAGDGERGIPLPATEGGCSPPPSEPYERIVVLPETVAAFCVILDVFRVGRADADAEAGVAAAFCLSCSCRLYPRSEPDFGSG